MARKQKLNNYEPDKLYKVTFVYDHKRETKQMKQRDIEKEVIIHKTQDDFKWWFKEDAVIEKLSEWED